MFELVIQSGKLQGKRLMLPVDKPVVVGRDEGCQLTLQSTLVSRRHTELKHVAQGIWVKDLGSQNGTYVNEVPLTEPVLMQAGDQLRIGAIVFEVQPGKESQPETRAASESTVKPAAAPAKARDAGRISDDDIADWLSDDDTAFGKGQSSTDDTTIIRGRPTPAPPSAISTATIAPKIPPKPKTFRSLKEEAADIIRRHWAKVQGESGTAGDKTTN